MSRKKWDRTSKLYTESIFFLMFCVNDHLGIYNYMIRLQSIQDSTISNCGNLVRIVLYTQYKLTSNNEILRKKCKCQKWWKLICTKCSKIFICYALIFVTWPFEFIWWCSFSCIFVGRPISNYLLLARFRTVYCKLAVIVNLILVKYRLVPVVIL